MDKHIDCRRCDPWAHPNAGFCEDCKASDRKALAQIRSEAESKETDEDRFLSLTEESPF